MEGNNTYFSSFIPGLSDIIPDILKIRFTDLNILHLFDGAIIYQTSAVSKEIKVIKCLNNSFQIIHLLDNAQNITFNTAIRKLMRVLSISSPVSLQKHGLPLEQKCFKIFFSDENQFISVDRTQRIELEKLISKLYKIHSDNSSQSYNEFWLLRRSEGLYGFMLRITNNKGTLQKGELRPELTNILCYLSDPTSQDIVLDPFAGSGAVIDERMQYSFKQIIAFDNNQECINRIRRKVKIRGRIHKNISIKLEDFLQCNLLPNSCTRLITDPPWGIYSNIDNIESFYHAILTKCVSVVVKGGIIVLLVDRKIDINQFIQPISSYLEILNKYDILLSGNKASIYKILKLL